MRGRGTALLRSVSAFLLATALVVGVPVLLVMLVGNPFPSELPTLNEIRILLTQNGQGFTNFLLSTLAIFVWVIWAQLIVALIAEVIATARQTETRRLRLAPGLQGLAARLVAAMTLATMLAAGPLVAPAVGALSFGDVEGTPATFELMMIDVSDRIMASSANSVATLAEPAPDPGPGSVAVDAAGAPSNEAAFMVVDEHTELWDLADAAYGDGVSWKLIASANAGAVDASGLKITAETESVAPGTELVLPGVIRSEQIGRFGSVADGGQQQVQSGESMWTIAEEHVAQRLGRPGTEAEVASHWAEVVAANQQIASGNVDVIYPGELLDVPGAELPDAEARDTEVLDAEPPVVESIQTDKIKPRSTSSTGDDMREPPSIAAPADVPVPDGPIDLRTTAQAATADSPVAEQPVDAPGPEQQSQLLPSGQVDTSADGPSAAPAIGLVGLGSAMLSAGVASAIRRRRDAQRRTRPAGTRAPSSSSEAAAFEAAVLHASHELKESTQGLGWRAMPASAVSTLRPGTVPEIHASATGDLIAVGVCAVADNGSQAQSEPDGQQRDTADQVTADLVTADQVTADLVTADLVTADLVTVDLVTADLVTVDQIPAMAASILVGTDAASGDAVMLDLIPSTTVALDGAAESIRRFVRSAVLDLAVSERADDVCVVAVAVGHELDDLERVHVVGDYPEAMQRIMRLGLGAPGSLTPVVVLATTTHDSTDDSLDDLLAAGAAVVAPGVDSVTRIAIAAEQATIQPSGTQATLVAFNDDEYRAVAELIETTSATSIELVDPTVQIEDLLDVAAVVECPVEPGPIELRILGPVEVQGASAFSSLKAVDVIAYLAFHRHGVDADQIKTWVWPPFDPPTDKAFANVMSRARTGLGAGDDGKPYLSRAGADKTYRLTSAVTTDFDRVRALGQLAEQSEDDATTLTMLKQALELIRGVPFTGGAASSFAWADNHVRAQVEYTIDELVHQCADLALELGDLATARWAALKGLALVPGCEQCFRRRFLVAGAGNNRSELRRAMADLEAAAMVDLGEPEAVDSISGELLDLYNELDSALVAGTA